MRARTYFSFLGVQWAGGGGLCQGRGSGTLPFQRAAPGPDPEGVSALACYVEVALPCLGGWPISLPATRTVPFPEERKPVSVELSLLPLEGSAAPAEGLGIWPIPLWAELFPEARLAREGCHRQSSCPALSSRLRPLFSAVDGWR